MSNFVKLFYCTMFGIILSLIVDGMILPRMISSTESSEVILGIVIGIVTLFADAYLVFLIINKYSESKDS